VYPSQPLALKGTVDMFLNLKGEVYRKKAFFRLWGDERFCSGLFSSCPPLHIRRKKKTEDRKEKIWGGGGGKWKKNTIQKKADSITKRRTVLKGVNSPTFF